MFSSTVMKKGSVKFGKMNFNSKKSIDVYLSINRKSKGKYAFLLEVS
jgi:hypothetical protein